MTRHLQSDKHHARTAGRTELPTRLRFADLGVLRRGDRAGLYRARDGNGHPVILKVLTSPRPAEVEKLAHEHEVTSGLPSSGVLHVLAMTTHDGLPALVFEDFGGVPLDSMLGACMDPVAFLWTAERIAAALAEVHRENVIHKDIKPENILIEPSTGRVKITGFEAATRLPRELQAGTSPRLIEGTFPYMSPEQTGRMNRPVDGRSDLYSLGVVFFEMLTARLPFEGRDPLEWIHCHVARPAPSPRAFVSSLPEPIAAIILKLLSKAAEDRYQTASGLAEDLAHCRAGLLEVGRVDPFPLATRDVPERLQLPQKLYGREAEIAVLEGAFRRVVEAGHAELALVSGYSGVGKSSLVHELLRSAASANANFVTGKLERHGGTVPNLALAQLFRPLVGELLGENEPELARWRERMSAALGPSARLVMDLIPELAILLGPQPDVPTLGLVEDERRFHVVFARFVSAFASAEHPLVLFLDDLQWADQASLRLLEHLITELASAPLLVVGAYRDNEVGLLHPLCSTIERLRAARSLVDHVVLAPLSVEHLTALVAETVRRPADEARSLAELLFVKTGGNPFFATHFMTEISRQGLLSFDHDAHAWRWDLQGIADKGYTDNVVDLMVVRIRQLPPQTLEIIELAASAGSVVSEKMLARICERSPESVRRDVFAAMREDLLVRAGDGYRCAHDRVRQAAYALVPERDRPGHHARIGRHLLESTSDAELAEHVFDIVSQLESGISVLTPEERGRLSELELTAGRRAKAAAAYVAAQRHLATGVSLLRQDAWEACPAFAFALHLERAECEFLAGNLELAKSLLAALRERARTKRQLAYVVKAEISVHVLMDQTSEAIAIGLTCVRAFGIEWSRPSWADVEAEYARFRRSLGDRRIEELIDLPVMVDPDAAALMDVLNALRPPVMFASSNLFCLVACRMVETSLTFGNAGSSAPGYLMLGMALVHFFDRFEDAYRFARLGYELVERLGTPLDRGRAYLDFAIVSAWARPLRDIHGFVERALEAARQCADVTHTCCIYGTILTLAMAQGTPLSKLERIAEEASAFARKTSYRPMELVITSVEQLIRHARGRTASFATFDDGSFAETGHEQAIEASSAPIASCVYHICKLVARYLAGEYEDALAAARTAKDLLWSTPSFIEVPEYHYLHALTRAALCDPASPVERQGHLAELREERERFRVWSEHCPENFLHRHALVAAETARVEGDHLQAERLYEQAIASAREQEFVRDEALGLELAGRYYLARGFARFGETYLGDARACYARWGAAGKVQQLEHLYPQIARCSGIAGARAFAARPEELDLLSVMKASQSIAEETELDDLIRRLMCVVIEQGVAQRGYLLLAVDGEPTITAEGRSTEAGIEARILSVSPAGSTLVPESLVKYVWRTREQVILADASDGSRRSRFVPPDYLARFHPKSVLCRPIVRRASMVGLLYLENDLVTDAFTPDRVAALDVLASQAAISLEIASSLQQERRARDALERSESRFRRLYESNMIGILFADLSGRITEANDYVLSTLGYTRRDLESDAIRWIDITPPEYVAADERAVEELRASRVCRPFEKQYIRKDGTRVPVFIGAALLEGSQDETVTFVVEMTERQRLLLQEKQARAEAEQALRAREEFMAIAAHELRTPLMPLKLQLRMLQGALAEENAGVSVSQEQKRLLRLFESADRQVDRLGRLVEDLLDVSTLDAKRLTLEPSCFDLAELARDVVERYRPDWTKASSAVEVQAERPVVGRWDRRRIEQVVVNLLANAIKYGAGRPIDLTVGEDADRARLSVRDRGIGIATEDQQRIFERFERAVPIKHFGGFGLGLHICREIVHAHGGSIRVESRAGEGAVFTVDLPLGTETPRKS